jgi:hypothetical protein
MSTFKTFVADTPVGNSTLARWARVPVGVMDAIAGKILDECPEFNPWVIAGGIDHLYQFASRGELEALCALTRDEFILLVGEDEGGEALEDGPVEFVDPDEVAGGSV